MAVSFTPAVGTVSETASRFLLGIPEEPKLFGRFCPAREQTGVKCEKAGGQTGRKGKGETYRSPFFASVRASLSFA